LSKAKNVVFELTNTYAKLKKPIPTTYAGMVSALDEAVGNITFALKEANMINDTIILFTTDVRQ